MLMSISSLQHDIVVLWFSKAYGYYTTRRVQPIHLRENHSTADLYYDATNQGVLSTILY